MIYLTWNSLRHRFVKKTSIWSPVKSLGYIKHYGLTSSRPVKSPSNSIWYNCQKICSWLKRPKPYWKSEKRLQFSRQSISLLFTSFSNILLTMKRRLTGQQFLAVNPNILEYRDHQQDLATIWKTRTPFDTNWRVQVVVWKFRLSSLEPPLE